MQANIRDISDFRQKKTPLKPTKSELYEYALREQISL